jgi:hypothetical protein
MEVTRKPLAKIEGRKRMQVSGLTVGWQGTRSLKDWMAYVEDGDERGRLVLAHQVSERTVKSLLARIQNLSRDELHAMGRPVEAVAQQGGGPPVRRSPGPGETAPGPEMPGSEMPGSQMPGSQMVVQPAGRQLALTGDEVDESAPAERPRRRRLTATVESAAPASRRGARVGVSRDLAGTVRQLRSRLESLEEEHAELRAELAVLRGEAEVYDGPPSIFVTGWFRATLVLIVLAIVVVVTVPWLMDLFEGGSREPQAPARTDAPIGTPAPPTR